MKKKEPRDHVKEVTDAFMYVAIIAALCYIITVDANNKDSDYREIELILVGAIAGKKVVEEYKKRSNNDIPRK